MTDSIRVWPNSPEKVRSFQSQMAVPVIGRSLEIASTIPADPGIPPTVILKIGTSLGALCYSVGGEELAMAVGEALGAELATNAPEPEAGPLTETVQEIEAGLADTAALMEEKPPRKVRSSLEESEGPLEADEENDSTDSG